MVQERKKVITKRLKYAGTYIKWSHKLCHKEFHTLSEIENIRLFDILRKSDDLKKPTNLSTTSNIFNTKT